LLACNNLLVADAGSHKKVSNGLVALSSAAVLAVYTAGYIRTKSAADRFALQAEARRPAIPAPATTGPSVPLTTPQTRTTAPAPDPTIAPQTDKPPRLTRSSNATHPSAEKTKVVARRSPTRSTEKSSPIAANAPAASVELPAAILEQTAAMPVPIVPEAPKSQYKDGTYFGWGTSRHGDIQAQVVIENGRIAAATIAQCLTRYSCSVIAKLPPQVAERQSPETDYVSGATQSTNAFYYAVVEALSKAK
jgi:uncharacterized protein with FMN-binding domain